MAKAVFAGPDVEKFSDEELFAAFALFSAEFAPFDKDLFLRNRPGDAGHHQRKNDEPKDLR